MDFDSQYSLMQLDKFLGPGPLLVGSPPCILHDFDIKRCFFCFWLNRKKKIFLYKAFFYFNLFLFLIFFLIFSNERIWLTANYPRIILIFIKQDPWPLRRKRGWASQWGIYTILCISHPLTQRGNVVYHLYIYTTIIFYRLYVYYNVNKLFVFT